jgi:outer membrane lipoprotein-sorting protein
MKKIIIITLSVLVSFAVSGQSKKADQLIKDVSDKIQSYESFKAEFTYEISGPDMDGVETDNGVLIVKDEKYRLLIAGQLIICDGETIWTYLEDAEEVQINSVEEEDGIITPSNILTFYDENYKSKFIKDEKNTENHIQVIELKPNEDRNFSKVDLTIDTEKMLVDAIYIFDKNGGGIRYSIDNFYPDYKTGEKDFIFKEEDYPGVEIIDMR